MATSERDELSIASLNANANAWLPDAQKIVFDPSEPAQSARLNAPGKEDIRFPTGASFFIDYLADGVQVFIRLPDRNRIAA